MQATPKANRLHLVIFGRRNVGKSSLINALTGQEVALVSEIPGTTTDPVFKAIEIPPLGPCMLIDTAGLDDTSKLGALRIKKTREVLDQTHLVLLVLDNATENLELERELKAEIAARNIPLIGVLNKIDQGTSTREEKEKQLGLPLIEVSALYGRGIDQLKEQIIRQAPADFEAPTIVGDLIKPGDLCLLVVPLDQAAPRGRLILPQVQTIRDILDHQAVAIMVGVNELHPTLDQLKNNPRLVITDSQVFPAVAKVTPDEIWLTSFSILFARFKGDLVELVKGARGIKKLKPGDRVLIAEACTHHRQEDDIGRVKIPRFLEQYIGGTLNFQWSSGADYPANLEDFQLIVHCGACMLNRRQMQQRLQQVREKGIPIVNYGVLLAYVHGILERTLQPFPQALAVLLSEN